MKLEVRRTFTWVEEQEIKAWIRHTMPLRRVAGAAVVTNPCAGRYAEDLSEAIKASVDTPTASSIMPLCMLYTITHLASLSAEAAITADTGNNAEVYRLNSGMLAEGRDADVIIDACAGEPHNDAREAIASGDVPAIAGIISDGIPRFIGGSRNSAAAIWSAHVAQCRFPAAFDAASH